MPDLTDPPDRPDLTRIDVRDPDRTDRIITALTRQGIALFTGVHDRGTLLSVGAGVMRVRTHRDSDPDGVTAIARRISYSATGSLAGFTDRELIPHTDGSAVPTPPRILMLTCLRRAPTGGHVVLVDGRDLHHAIATTDPDMLAALHTPRSAFFGGAAGHLGSVFQPTPDHRVTVRLRFDDLIRLSPVASLYLGPLRELVRHHQHTVNLNIGEGYVLLNDWWLHGRTRFTGTRLMLRLIGDPTPNTPIAAGFQPSGTRLTITVP